MLPWTEYAKFFIALLVIVDPIGVAPAFLGMTAGQSPVQRHRTARTAAVVVVLVLIGAAVAGEWILWVFGISIPSFRVGAGVLLLLMAIDMLYVRVSASRQTHEEAQEAEDRDQVAIVPLAIPLTAGPGAIGTVILYRHQSSDWSHVLLVCLLIAAVGACIWLALRLAVLLSSALGKTGVNIATRIMGLLLAAIAVEFIVDGLSHLFPLLSHPG
jgi:multiple antibiotic resistance protein